MPLKKCDYCEARASSKQSLTDQGWNAILMWVTVKGTSHRFHARACPLHMAELNKAVSDWNESVRGV